jgi:membrane protein implicated in regulation of membrane protease activity
MKPGLLEIILIIVVIIAIAVIARIVRRRDGATIRKRSTDRDSTGKSTGGNSGRAWDFLNKTGIILVIGGIAAFIAAVSFFRMVLQGYLWAFILVAVGLILVLLSRKRR